MKDTVVAGRYARAFFQAAQSAKKEELAQQQLHRLYEALRSTAPLAGTLQHPFISVNEKFSAIEKILGSSLPLFGRFVVLLLQKKRLNLLPQIVAAFDQLADKAHGRRRVHIKSATPLSNQALSEWKDRLSKTFGDEIMAETSVDEDLLAGVIIQSGDRVWDQSLREQLRRLKENLSETQR